MDSNYIIKVYDKDDTFKRTLSRKDINGDIRYSSVLNSGFSTLPLRIQNKREEQTNTETTYERLLDQTYNGTVSGGVTIDDGAIVFDGSGSITSSNPGGVFSSGDYSINTVIEFSSFASSYNVVIQPKDGTGTGRIILSVFNLGVPTWSVINASAQRVAFGEFGTVLAGVEYTVTAVLTDTNQLTLTVNGVSVTKTVTQDDGNGDIVFGASKALTQFMSGTISTISLYSRAITASEVTKLQEGGIITDGLVLSYSGLKYTGTAGSPTTILNALPDNTEITTTVSSTLGIDHGDIIKVIDPNQNVVTTVDTGGGTYYKTVTDTPIYTGQVIEINHNIAPDQEYHDVDVIGIQTLLNQTLYEHGSSYTFTRTADPAVILKEVIDLVGYLNYTVDSIETYGSNVSVEFDYSTCMDAMKEIQSITGCIVKYDADGTVYFTEEVSSPTIDHKLDFTGEISAVYDETKSYEIVNKLTLHHKASGVGHTDVFEDLTSQGTYGIREKYIDKQEIQNEDTAAEFGNAYIARYANPLQQLKVVVNNKYDIASVKVGDTVKIYGYYNASSTYYIYKLDFTPDNLTLYLNEQRSIETTLYNLINN